MNAKTVIIVISAITFTFSMFMPEKLPIDQLCRFTMFASSAKVTASSVTEEHI